MKIHSAKIYIRILAVAAIIILGFFAGVSREKTEVVPIVSSSVLPQIEIQKTEPAVKKDLSPKITAEAVPVQTITLAAGDVNVQLPLRAGQTLSEVLLSAQKNGSLNVSGTNYPGLGFFVTDVGSLHQGDGKYLVYFINGTEASVGASSYVPKNGDVISWKLQ